MIVSFLEGENILKLSEGHLGEAYRISDLSHLNKVVQKRLLDLGVIEGVEISYIRKMPFGGPYILEVCGQYISLRKKDVDYIEVEEV
ncbi:ferrous iron transport protein A [Ureibacillus thermophilus]|uniref:Ferrous iron transport protein A n=1 Tax=Ureibacillus thermophilus TaxID=367743 RepID=A0A4P6UW29_9BACL|nr:ferrous iron transport protein A [Ureibacillus thermophilus]